MEFSSHVGQAAQYESWKPEGPASNPAPPLTVCPRLILPLEQQYSYPSRREMVCLFTCLCASSLGWELNQAICVECRPSLLLFLQSFFSSALSLFPPPIESLGKLKVTPRPGHSLHYNATPYIEDNRNTFVNWMNGPDTNAEVTIPKLTVTCTQEVKIISNRCEFHF